MSYGGSELPRWARAVLSLLLQAFPGAYRTRFGPEMREFVVRDYRERGNLGSGWNRFSFWILTFRRLLSSALAVRVDAVRGRAWKEDRLSPKGPGGVGGIAELVAGSVRAFRFALRSLLRAPAYSLTTVVTLALGLGACTWIFTVVQPVLLAPLPYPESHRLVVLYERSPEPEGQRGWVSPLTYRDWTERTTTLGSLANYRLNLFAWLGVDGPRILEGSAVSHDFFRVLGVEMTLGRGFTEEEDRPGARKVVVISRPFWGESFGGDPEVLGKTLNLDGSPYTIIGVAGADLEFPWEADYWVPAATDYGREFRDFRYLGVVGRLREDVTLGEAQEELDRLGREIARENPETNEGWGVELRGMKEDRVEWVRPVLLAMSVAVGLLLLVALGNVTNLSVARSVGKRGDAAIRAALGAGRGAMARLFLTEALLLTVAGSLLGLLFAHIGVVMLAGLAPAGLPGGDEISLGPGSMAFAVASALVMGTSLGLLSFLLAAGRRRVQHLRIGGPRGGASGGAHRLREGVLIVQVGMALALLVGATLLSRSLITLSRVDVGFNPDNLLTFSWELPQSAYQEEAAQRGFQRDLLSRVADVPGVEAAGFVTPLPIEMGSVPSSWTLAPGVSPAGSSPVMAHMRTASTGYLEAMGLRLVSGRFIGPEDREATEQVCVVNRSFVARYLPGTDPLGKRITFGEADAPESDWLTIVGVVDDVRFRSLRSEGEPEIYLSSLQTPSQWGTLVVRSPRPSQEMTRAVWEALGAVDPGLPFGEVKTGREILAGQLSTSRLTTILMALFAIVATTLSLVGIMGVLSIVVAHRIPEMGIRVALGATPAGIWRLVLLRGMGPVALGLILGLGLSFFGTRLLSSQIYGVSLLDPLAFALPSAGLALVAVLACQLPARRAREADPVSLLKSE